MVSHLLIGSGGEVGRELSGRLLSKKEQVLVTSHRTIPPPASDSSTPHPIRLSWDFNTPEAGLSDIVKALGPSSLRSLSLFAHPPFTRQKGIVAKIPLFHSLSSLEGLALLLDHLLPMFEPRPSVLFFFPSLSHHKADAYLPARAWIGAFQGFFEEWSRAHRECVVTGIEILITPDSRTPHLSSGMISRISDRTSRGRLARADEIADFAAYLIRSGNPLFHGQILRTEGGPYY